MTSKTNASLKDEVFHAIQANNLDALKSLVNSSNVNMKDRSGYSLLHIATNLEKNEIAKWLVSVCGADLNMHCNNHTVLTLALNKSNFELFDFYLENKAECIGRSQLNLLHEATNKNRYDILERLIEKGADPNQYNNMQITPLTIAVQNKNKRIILLLLESGACANLPDKKGNTAMHLACSLADAEIINVLLDNTECDLRLKNVNEETPFDLYWTSIIKESKMPDANLIMKIVELGGLFSMPWNFTFNNHNHLIFIKSISHLCKYKLHDLFVNEKPLFNELIINGYWRNSLIVSIKSVIIENSKVENQHEVYKAIEQILLSKEFDLTESDLMSTIYMIEADLSDSELTKSLKRLFHQPFSLKSLARVRVRQLLGKLDQETLDKLNLNSQIRNFLLFQHAKTNKAA